MILKSKEIKSNSEHLQSETTGEIFYQVESPIYILDDLPDKTEPPTCGFFSLGVQTALLNW